MERLKKYFFIIIIILLIGYFYNYLMEISALFTGNRKLLSKMKIIESKIDNLIKNREKKVFISKKKNKANK